MGKDPNAGNDTTGAGPWKTGPGASWFYPGGLGESRQKNRTLIGIKEEHDVKKAKGAKNGGSWRESAKTPPVPTACDGQANRNYNVLTKNRGSPKGIKSGLGGKANAVDHAWRVDCDTTTHEKKAN